MAFSRIFLIGFCGIILVCCKQFGGKNEPHSSDPSFDVTNEVPVKIEQKDTSVIPTFIEYHKEGLILPGVHKIYDEHMNVRKKIQIAGIEKLSILQKSKSKHPQLTNQDYCYWSNYLQVVYKRDTLLMFGGSVLEIGEQYGDIVIQGDTGKIIVASDFSMEAGDDDGLTGCDDFSYIILTTGNNEYFKIYNQNPATDNTINFATLTHDDGMSEHIDNFSVNADTIVFKIKVEFQEGTGAYNLKIYKAKEWKFLKTDEKRDY